MDTKEDLLFIKGTRPDGLPASTMEEEEERNDNKRDYIKELRAAHVIPEVNSESSSNVDESDLFDVIKQAEASELDIDIRESVKNEED